MTSKALVGPLPTIRFQYGRRTVVQAYDVPKDTMDRRYAECTDHHPACDCREAHIAEALSEHQAERKDFWDAAAKELIGHRLKDFGDIGPPASLSRAELGDEMWWRYISGDGPLACQCTGCRIARAGHASLKTDDDGIVIGRWKWAR